MHRACDRDLDSEASAFIWEAEAMLLEGDCASHRAASYVPRSFPGVALMKTLFVCVSVPPVS